jgi:hypothetical protein
MVLRRFLAFFLLVTLTVSSVAMPVFTHVCNGMDKTWSSLFVPPADCCDNASNTTKICVPDTKTSQDCALSKQPCCEDEVSLAALGADFTVHYTSALTQFPIAAIPGAHFYPNLIGYPTYTALQTNRFDHFPTPRYGRSLLIFEQLFLC